MATCTPGPLSVFSRLSKQAASVSSTPTNTAAQGYGFADDNNRERAAHQTDGGQWLIAAPRNVRLSEGGGRRHCGGWIPISDLRDVR